MSRENVTLETQVSSKETNIYVMMILSSAIASLGIISNVTVVVVFLRNKKLRIKIPNIFIINQVGKICHSRSLSFLEHVCPIHKSHAKVSGQPRVNGITPTMYYVLCAMGNYVVDEVFIS